MAAHDITEKGTQSLAEVCVDLLQKQWRKLKSEGTKKRAKREQQSKYSRYYHHVENKDDVRH